MNAQTIAKRLAESGCYFLSLLHIVNKDNDAIGLYRQAVQLDFMDEDCFVKVPENVLALAVGGKWLVRHEPASYLPNKDESEILRFERKAEKVYSHFVVGDGKGNVIYDPLDTSQTVASGKLVSKRIVLRIKS